jgi:hypothetical protein
MKRLKASPSSTLSQLCLDVKACSNLKGRAGQQQHTSVCVAPTGTQGMYWEAQGQYDQAEEIYKDMILNRPTCEIAHKRLVSNSSTRLE